MKKLLISTLVIALQMALQANADQIVCRGNGVTLKLSDKYDQIEGNIVTAHVWTAQYDQARYADLFSAVIPGYESVKELKRVNRISVESALEGALNIDLENMSMQLENKKVGSISESMKCKTIKGSPTLFQEIGAGNSR